MKKSLILLAFTFVASLTFAQDNTIPDARAQKKFFDSSAVVLPILIKVAITNAPEVKRLQATRKIADVDYKISKNEVLKQIYLNANYNYGSTQSEINGVQTRQINAFSSGGSAIYLVGLNVTFSLEQMFGGISSRINKQKLVVEQAKEDNLAGEGSIRVKIITLYNALLLSKVLYDHAEDALQTAYVNRNLVDKQFKANEVKVTDEMASNDLYARAQTEREQTKSNYQLNLLLLEEAIGMPVNQFIKDNVK